MKFGKPLHKSKVSARRIKELLRKKAQESFDLSKLSKKDKEWFLGSYWAFDLSARLIGDYLS